MSDRGKTILVVDDEESMRYFLAKTLKREGYEVIEASDGPAALAAAQARPPDMALLDVRMPGMDGVALMRALRSSLPSLPVILMTAYGSVQNALHAMKYGAADYITKPFRVDDIRATVARLLASQDDRPPTLRTALADAEAAEALAVPEVATPDGATEEPPRGVAAFLRERAEDRGLPLSGLPAARAGLREVVRLCELVYVDELLDLTGGNISRAAEMAGITRPNMHRKVIDLGLDANDYRRRSGSRGAREEVE